MSNENREAVALDIILHEAERSARAECGGACGSPNCASINARRNAALARSEVERLQQAERERDEARRALADRDAEIERLRAVLTNARAKSGDLIADRDKMLRDVMGERDEACHALADANARLAAVRDELDQHDICSDWGFIDRLRAAIDGADQ